MIDYLINKLITLFLTCGIWGNCTSLFDATRLAFGDYWGFMTMSQPEQHQENFSSWPHVSSLSCFSLIGEHVYFLQPVHDLAGLWPSFSVTLGGAVAPEQKSVLGK